MKVCFGSLIGSPTEGVEFGFNKTMYAQVDLHTLCPVLTNICVGFYESVLFEKFCKIHVYHRYVDDTFSIFDSIIDDENIHNQLNSFRVSIQFTITVKNGCTFLDVLVEGNKSTMMQVKVNQGQYERE